MRELEHRRLLPREMDVACSILALVPKLPVWERTDLISKLCFTLNNHPHVPMLFIRNRMNVPKREVWEREVKIPRGLCVPSMTDKPPRARLSRARFTD